MTLSAGTKLGPYEVVDALGAGGMGEVYRARDTKLNRDVALKVLPEAFAQDAERMARFRREAQVLASLNHPNIATIYGLEESNGNCALVMELVEGPTLAERIAGTQPLTRPAAGGPPSPLARGESKKQGEMPADGSGAAEPLTTGENALFPGSWSPDGQALVFTQADPTDWLGHLDARAPGDRKPRPFLQTPSNEYGPMFSPDGRRLAYQSDESGRSEIYVRPFPGPGGKVQISTEGGVEPVWARYGRELFYRNGDKMMVTAVETQPVFVASKPKLLFEGHYETGLLGFEPDYDVSPDGQRFLANG